MRNISPKWWNHDSGFRAVLNACSVANTVAHKSGGQSAAVLTVLRPKFSDYSHEDFMAIGELLSSGTSDVWIIPYDKAGEYKNQDVIVLGQEQVLQLQGNFDSPAQAFGAFNEVNNESMAKSIRVGIERATQHAVRIRAGEVKSWQDAQTILRNVIDSDVRPVSAAAQSRNYGAIGQE